MVERRTENPYVGGSIPPQGTTYFLSGFAGVAQLAEQLICNQQVAGSIPVTSSTHTITTAVERAVKLNNGRFAEWPNASDCKSDVSDFGGSNPPPPTTKKDRFCTCPFSCVYGGVSENHRVVRPSA